VGTALKVRLPLAFNAPLPAGWAWQEQLATGWPRYITKPVPVSVGGKQPDTGTGAKLAGPKKTYVFIALGRTSKR